MLRISRNDKIKLFFSKFDFSIFDQKKDKFYSFYFNKNEKFNDEEFESYFKSILDLNPPPWRL